MALVRPTLPELVARIQTDLTTRLGLTGPLRRRSTVYVLARVLAGAVHMLYGAISYLAKQLFADQSDEAYLLRDASVYGLAPTPATYAQATVTVTGTSGSSVPAGAVMRDASGLEYEVDTGFTLPGGGTHSAGVTAVAAGAASSLSLGAVLTFEATYAGVVATAPVTAKVDGSDREATEDFRTRFLALKASRGGHGGSVADYIAWAKEVSGVTRVWVAPQGAGPGTVLVRFVRDNDGTGAAIIPDVGEVAAMQSHLDGVKPASCALVQVMAPVDGTQDLGLHISPDTPELRAAAVLELQAMFKRRMTPVGGGTVYRAWIQTAVGDVAGIDLYDVTYPAADVPYADGVLIRLGGITWT